MLFFSLVKNGFGTLEEIKKLDTDDIMQILEYESILADIQELETEEAKREK